MAEPTSPLVYVNMAAVVSPSPGFASADDVELVLPVSPDPPPPPPVLAAADPPDPLPAPDVLPEPVVFAAPVVLGAPPPSLSHGVVPVPSSTVCVLTNTMD